MADRCLGARTFRISRILVAASVCVLVACAPAAAPSPTAVPVKPAEAAQPPPKPTEAPVAKPAEAKPAAAASPAAKAEAKPADKPAAVVSPAAKPAAKIAPPADWQAQWDKILAEAKREGTVMVCCPTSAPNRTALLEFNKDYPDIRADVFTVDVNQFLSRIVAERQGGQFLWDVLISGSSLQRELKPKGVLDPVRPALLLPEVLDDSKWLNGFDSGWSDSEMRYVFMYQASVGNPGWVNRDFIAEPELRRMEEVIDPKYKGKIAFNDPRRAGAGSGNAGHLVYVLGDDFLRKLLSNGVVVSSDGRQLVEWLVRGQHPIAFGVNSPILREFRSQGLGLNVKPIAPETPAGARLSTGGGGLHLINRPAHPNAAKVYANWLLSKAGQSAWSRNNGEISRRLDVTEGDPQNRPAPNAKLIDLNDEESLKVETRTNQIAKEVLGG